VSNFNDLAGFGAFMVSLWELLPDIVRGLILAVAALFVIIGVIQLMGVGWSAFDKRPQGTCC